MNGREKGDTTMTDRATIETPVDAKEESVRPAGYGARIAAHLNRSDSHFDRCARYPSDSLAVTMKCILSCILVSLAVAAILVVLAFPRYSRQNTGDGTLSFIFFTPSVKVSLPFGAPSRYEWYAVHFYPIWAIGGLNYYYDGSGHPIVFRQGPMWWLAIVEFLTLAWLVYVLLAHRARSRARPPTTGHQQEAQA
jgi:hypothetical protein